MRTIGRRKIPGLLAGLGVVAALAGGCRSADVPVSPIPAEAGKVEPQAVRVDSAVRAAADAARPPGWREVPPAARDFEAPAGWESLTDLAFERAIDGWLPSGEARRTSEATLADLRRALGGGDVPAVRAAVMLARTRDPSAGEILLGRLEERVATPPGESERDAADVVAAAAFGVGMSAKEAAARLTGLAVGRRPHPSLSVRVECARSAIALGRDESIASLLAVLREGTTAGRVVGAEGSQDDLAWAQVRAAQALAARAGTTNRFRPEASVKEREDEAARLEGLLPSRTKR